MPEIWNDMVVVTEQELIPAYWNSYEGLKKELQRYANKRYGIKRAQRGGNGCRLLIKYESLAKEIQIALGDPTKSHNPLEKFYEVDSKAVNFYQEFTYPDGSYIIPESQEKYIINASTVQAILKLKPVRIKDRLSKGGSLRGLMNSLCEDTIKFVEVLRVKHDVELTLPTHPARFTEAVSKFEAYGYVSLVKDAEAKSKQNAKKLTDETVQLLNNLFTEQKHKPTPTEIHRQYNAFIGGYMEIVDPETGELYDRRAFKALSERSITTELTKWQNKIATYAMRSSNRQQLMQQFKPYHSLEQPTMSGSLISIDDRQPPFWYEKGKRAWFYVGIDLASEAIVCWVHGKSKEGIITDFYRQLIRNYTAWGLPIPSGIECESALNSSFKDTFLLPGAMFEYVRIEANNARGKRIEAYFKPLRYGLEKERMGWIARPNPKSEANQARTDKPNMIIPYEDIIDGCLQDIVTWNNTAHSKNTDMSRWDYFIGNQNPQVKPTNYKGILPYLGKKTLSSCNVGIIKLQNSEWLLGDNGQIALGEDLIRLMRQVEGEDVELHWIDDNEGKVDKAMIFKNGRYICEILPKPKYNRAQIEWTDADREARSIMSAYVATIEAFGRTQIRTLQPITIIDNRPKTIGTSFSIDGIKKYIPSPEPAEDLGFEDTAHWDYEDAVHADNISWNKKLLIK